MCIRDRSLKKSLEDELSDFSLWVIPKSGDYKPLAKRIISVGDRVIWLSLADFLAIKEMGSSICNYYCHSSNWHQCRLEGVTVEKVHLFLNKCVWLLNSSGFDFQLNRWSVASFRNA